MFPSNGTNMIGFNHTLSWCSSNRLPSQKAAAPRTGPPLRSSRWYEEGSLVNMVCKVSFKSPGRWNVTVAPSLFWSFPPVEESLIPFSHYLVLHLHKHYGIIHDSCRFPSHHQICIRTSELLPSENLALGIVQAARHSKERKQSIDFSGDHLGFLKYYSTLGQVHLTTTVATSRTVVGVNDPPQTRSVLAHWTFLHDPNQHIWA